jgi:hypothetical protein
MSIVRVTRSLTVGTKVELKEPSFAVAEARGRPAADTSPDPGLTVGVDEFVTIPAEASPQAAP